MIYLGILTAAVSKSYTTATHINMGSNVLVSCLSGKFSKLFNLVKLNILHCNH